MGTHFTGRINLEIPRKAIKDGAGKGLQLALEHVLTEANKTVPHDEGTLERSGFTSVDTAKGRGAVSYDTPYAVRQHEDMTLHHDGKGRAKWLENTLTDEAGTVGDIVAQSIRNGMGG